MVITQSFSLKIDHWRYSHDCIRIQTDPSVKTRCGGAISHHKISFRTAPPLALSGIQGFVLDHREVLLVIFNVISNTSH